MSSKVESDSNLSCEWWKYDAHSKIQEIFEKCQAANEDWTVKLKSFFAEEIPKICNELPWLNETPVHTLKPNQVVRFRGMIQDMHDPEFYVDSYVVQKADGTETLRPGRYLDFVSCAPSEEILINSPQCKTKDRNSYMCISVPGESQWVKQVYKEKNPKVEIVSSPHKNYNISNKREYPFEIENGGDNSVIEEKAVVNEVKKIKNSNEQSNATVINDPTLPFPYPDMNGMACVLKTYSDDDLRLNDVIEVIGILSTDPAVFTLSQNETEQTCSLNSDETMENTSLSSSLVTRLHVLSLRKKRHCNPLLPSTEEADLPSCSSNIRELISSVFDAAFLGDELAAEYFICHLISSVYLRQDIQPIGKFSINLSGITQELQAANYPKLLFELIETLVTQCHFLPITLENLVKLNFIPRKDYQKNCLMSGLLQLPSQFHLILDETKLSAGQLNSEGIKNLTALGNVINWQKVDYDFKFHNIEQHTDVPVLILSEGKSMINCDYEIRLDPKNTDVSSAFRQISSLLNPQVLENLRTHLTLARLGSYNFTTQMEQMVQNDFVSSRKHEGGMTTEDLHRLLTLAKLLAQSCGSSELTEEIWRSAKMLETERKGRLRKQT